MSVSKGVASYNEVLNYFMTIDRLRGATYGQLARKYKLDKSGIHERVKKYGGMVKLVDTRDLKSLGCNDCPGSNPGAPTNN